jgi:hypothetical protein
VFWPEPVGRLLNGDRDRLRETLDRLEGRELVASRLSSSIAGEQEFIFKHVLTREVAYDSLPRRERAAAHAAVAFWIEETAGGRTGEFTELLAYHYLEAFRAARTEDTAERTDKLRRRAMSALLDVSREARSRFATRKAIASAERALGLAVEPIERIASHEAMGLAARSDYRGDQSWSHLKAAIDLRLEHAPEDRRSIAWACAMALENPLRWPGSMQELPDPEEVRRYLEIGFAHVDDAGGEESTRLLTLRAFEPFGFGHRIRIGTEDRARAYDSGIRAADLAQRLGRLDLESAALDGAGSAIIGEGLYGHPRFDKLIGRRLEIAELLEDPWELGDIYAMGAWNKAMIGEYEESVRIGFIGRERAEGAEGLASHSLNWVTVSLFHLGEWDRLLEVFDEIRTLLGERAEEPPYFVMNGYGAAAFALDARGHPGAGPLLDVLERSRKTIVLGSAAASYWRALAAARHGEVDRAWAVMHEAELEDDVGRPLLDEVTAELLAVTARWAEVQAFVDASRPYARDAQLVALPVHLDRLEGRAAAATGELERGLELLGAAREGFGRLGAAWERARTELDLAEALAEAGAFPDAHAMVDAAAPDLERVGALRELDRLRVLRARLG